MAKTNTKVAVENFDFSKLTKNSLLIVRCESAMVPEIQELLMDSKFVPKAAYGLPVLFLRPDEALESVSEERMRLAGWKKV